MERRERCPNFLASSIGGGNHGGFGSYGLRSGDNEAGITPDEQWDITARAVSELIAEGRAKE